MKYENKYGYVVFEKVSNYMMIGDFKNSYVTPDCFFSLEKSEAISLITEQKELQFGVKIITNERGVQESMIYLLHHESPNSVCLLKVLEFQYLGEDKPRDIIAMENKARPLFLYMIGKNNR